MTRCEDVGPWIGRPRAGTILKSEEVAAMLHLHGLGWGMRRIARELGCSRNTVRRYVAADGWMSYSRGPVAASRMRRGGWRSASCDTAAMRRRCARTCCGSCAFPGALFFDPVNAVAVLGSTCPGTRRTWRA